MKKCGNSRPGSSLLPGTRSRRSSGSLPQRTSTTSSRSSGRPGRSRLGRTRAVRGSTRSGRMGAVIARTRESAAASQHRRLWLFYATSIGRCLRLRGYLAQVLQRPEDRARFEIVEIDVTEWPDLAAHFQIDAVPTLLVTDEQGVRGLLSNPGSRTDIAALLAPWLL